MILKAAFMFIAPNVNPEKHKSIVKTEAVHLITVGVNSYESAEEQARKLVEGGVTVIELCGGADSEEPERSLMLFKGRR